MSRGSKEVGWTFHEGDLDGPDVQALLKHHYAEARAISPPEGCHVLSIDELRERELTFWSLRDADGTLLGFGALKELSPDHGEVKSMRTAPHALGRGIGTAMLDQILREACLRGYRRISLETGSTPPYRPAICLYERHGFERCDPFGDYRATAFNLFYTRQI